MSSLCPSAQNRRPVFQLLLGISDTICSLFRGCFRKYILKAGTLHESVCSSGAASLYLHAIDSSNTRPFWKSVFDRRVFNVVHTERSECSQTESFSNLVSNQECQNQAKRNKRGTLEIKAGLSQKQKVSLKRRTEAAQILAANKRMDGHTARGPGGLCPFIRGKPGEKSIDS